MRVPPVPPGLERAAGWSWRLLVCAAALLGVLVLLWYLQVIVLPAIIALTLAPALTPLAERFRRMGLGRAAPGLALVAGLLVLAALVSLVTLTVAQEFDELSAAFREGADELTEWLEGDPLNLSFDSDRSVGDSLSSVWQQGSEYLVSGVRSGVAVVTGLVLAVALLYFVLRDGRALWERVLGLFSPDRAPVSTAPGSARGRRSAATSAAPRRSPRSTPR